jgi:hypothetical protein
MRTSSLDIDLGDPATYRDGVPHHLFAQLRRTRPVAWVGEPPTPGFPGGPGYWAVTRYADVVHVCKNPQLFSSQRGSVELRDQCPEDLAALQQIMLNLDPPQHSKLRSIISRAFTPKTVAELSDGVRAHARRVVEALEPDSEIDIVERVCAELPLLVLADVLGVPAGDRGLLFSWSNRLVGHRDATDDAMADFVAASTELFRYAAEQTRAKRRRPTSDVWSLVVNAEVDGERLSYAELFRFFQLLVIAGNETTRTLLSGAVRLLDQHPDQAQRLREDPELWAGAVEEVLRYRSPVIQFRRTATGDTRVGEQLVRDGEKVVVFYVSANRDESVFDEPDAFDIGRTPNQHLAFGIGPHFCLGTSLARLEGRALLSTLYARFPRLRVSGDLVRYPSNFLNGIAALPVALGPAA